MALGTKLQAPVVALTSKQRPATDVTCDRHFEPYEIKSSNISFFLFLAFMNSEVQCAHMFN